MRATRFVAVVIVVLVVVALGMAAWDAVGDRRGRTGDGPADVGVVTHIVDGDTIDVEFGDGTEERIRLVGIDTPESVNPDAPVECHGPEASAFLADLLPVGTEVRIERDVEARDRFGRLLAYVFRQPDGTFVNEAIAAAGEAEVLSIPPNTAYADVIGAAVGAAQAADLGLWGAC